MSGLFGLFGRRAYVVGEKIARGDIREFWYTVSTSTDPPLFQRYRFTKNEDRVSFYHEKREGDHWPLRETDITVSGTLELSSEQRDRLYALLAGGTVSEREESLECGDSGPWLYLYWTRDRGKYREYEFTDYGRRLEFEEFCGELKAAEENTVSPEERKRLMSGLAEFLRKNYVPANSAGSVTGAAASAAVPPMQAQAMNSPVGAAAVPPMQAQAMNAAARESAGAGKMLFGLSLKSEKRNSKKCEAAPRDDSDLCGASAKAEAMNLADYDEAAPEFLEEEAAFEEEAPDFLEEAAEAPVAMVNALSDRAEAPAKRRRTLQDAVNELSETWQQSLLRKIDERGFTDAEVYKRAGLDRKLFSKIRGNEQYQPKKSTAVALALALRLSLDETKDLLARAGYALSPSSRFDLIVEYFIDNEVYDIGTINEALCDHGEALLGA